MKRLTRRRDVLRFLITTGGTAAMAPVLSACQPNKGKQNSVPLIISNWPLFIDTDQPGVAGSVRRFEQATGIDVIYREDLNDPDSFFSRIRLPLAMGQPVEQDILIVPNWLASRLIRLNWLEPLPWAQIGNASNLEDSLKKPLWDPKGLYSLPWMVGITGIAYNIKSTGRELNSVDDLFAKELHGRVSFLSMWRDTLGLLMLADGKNITAPTYKDTIPALQRLEQAKTSGQIRSFTGNDYQKDLLVGNLAACVAWAGDVAQLMGENPDLRFVVPKTGGVLTADVMVIPRKADGKREAAQWMNYVYDPINAARIDAATHFISPVKGVKKVFAASSSTAKLIEDPLMFPDKTMANRLHMLGPFSDQDEIAVERQFSKLIAS
jgi:spermidine/putrescine transport system substrate-binding protein